MVEIICAIISGFFALISAVFGGISIYYYKKTNKQIIHSGKNSKNVQVGEYNYVERNTKD